MLSHDSSRAKFLKGQGATISTRALYMTNLAPFLIPKGTKVSPI